MISLNIFWLNFQTEMVVNANHHFLLIIFRYIIRNTRSFNVITPAVLLGFGLIFLRLMICSFRFVLTFFTTVTSLLIFSFVECSWNILSFSFDIWLRRLDISESTRNFPFKAIIFCASSDFFMAFIADSDKVNKLILS